MFFLIPIFVILLIIFSESEFGSCTSEWYITGYFVPVESDYSGNLIDVTVNDEDKQYDVDFLDVVRIEGWGRTNSGDYLGWYDDSYHLNDVALDSHDNPLIVGMIAVDTSLIKHGSDVLIPTLPTRHGIAWCSQLWMWDHRLLVNTLMFLQGRD